MVLTFQLLTSLAKVQNIKQQFFAFAKPSVKGPLPSPLFLFFSSSTLPSLYSGSFSSLLGKLESLGKILLRLLSHAVRDLALSQGARNVHSETVA